MNMYVCIVLRLTYTLHETCTHTYYMRHYRDADVSDTEDTDEDRGWGGLGMFEYSKRGLPHSLCHAAELVETYGHHGAACTCVGEAGHKHTIKNASRFARTYGDRNQSQEGMLSWVQRELLWSAVFEMNNSITPASPTVSESAEDHTPTHKLREPLDLTDGWSHTLTVGTRPPLLWASTFLSKRVLITRVELVTLLRTKLEMNETWENITLLAKLRWECFGCAMVGGNGGFRKVVGISGVSPQRRDFVRLNGSEHGTALSAQVIMFVRVSGLAGAGVRVPETLRVPANSTCNENELTLALVRWLSPNPRALLRDDRMLPLCPPPFGINHALWTFAKTRRQRGYLSDNLFARQLHLFPGKDLPTKRQNAASLKYAMYDLIRIETIDTFMNCTRDENENYFVDNIMETITLPFL